MKALLTDYLEYNVWANKYMVSLFENHPSIINLTIVNSFPSVKLTFNHIWVAQYIWLNRLQQQSINNDTFVEDNLALEIKPFFEVLINNSKAYRDYVLLLSEEDLLIDCSYHSRGTDYQTAVYAIVHHTMNHSTYQRGQLVTLARQAGIDNIKSTDFTTYLRSK